jgi:hypothetical protein
VTTGGINWQSRNARVRPSKNDSGNSVYIDMGGTQGSFSVTTVSPVYSSGMVGENMNEGDIPSHGPEVE